MSSVKTIRGTDVDADVVELATDDTGLITAIVGFFDGRFPRSSDNEPDALREKARDRIQDRATKPPQLLRK